MREFMTPIDYAPMLGPVPLEDWADVTRDLEAILRSARADGLMPCSKDGQWIPLDMVLDEGISGVYLDAPPDIFVGSACDQGSGEGEQYWLSADDLSGDYKLYDVTPIPPGVQGLLRRIGPDHAYHTSEVRELQDVLDWATLAEHLSMKGDPFVGFKEGRYVYRLLPYPN